jgi:hypothetical protein
MFDTMTSGVFQRRDLPVLLFEPKTVRVAHRVALRESAWIGIADKFHLHERI